MFCPLKTEKHLRKRRCSELAHLPNNLLWITAVATAANTNSLNLAFLFPVTEGVWMNIDHLRGFLNRQKFWHIRVVCHILVARMLIKVSEILIVFLFLLLSFAFRRAIKARSKYDSNLLFWQVLYKFCSRI